MEKSSGIFKVLLFLSADVLFLFVLMLLGTPFDNKKSICLIGIGVAVIFPLWALFCEQPYRRRSDRIAREKEEEAALKDAQRVHNANRKDSEYFLGIELPLYNYFQEVKPIFLIEHQPDVDTEMLGWVAACRKAAAEQREIDEEVDAKTDKTEDDMERKRRAAEANKESFEDYWSAWYLGRNIGFVMKDYYRESFNPKQ